MDMGVINEFKSHYKKHFNSYIISYYDNEHNKGIKIKLPIEHAISWVESAWESVKNLSIINCWRKSGVWATNDDKENGICVNMDIEEDVNKEKEIKIDFAEDFEIYEQGESLDSLLEKVYFVEYDKTCNEKLTTEQIQVIRKHLGGLRDNSRYSPQMVIIINK